MTHFNPNTPWRRISTAIYSKPLDGRIFGTVELDVTELEDWVSRQRQEGLKITLMYPLLLLAARALRHDVPELNCYVSRGRILHRPSVDIIVSVLMKKDNQMGTLRLRNADRMTIPKMAEWMNTNLQDHRQEDQEGAAKQKVWLDRLGWPLRNLVIRLWQKVVIDWGIRIPFTRMGPDAFGSIIFSNIGSIGLDVGYPALLPVSNVSMVLVMGSVQTKPAVVGDQIMPRRILNLSATLDHRLVDAYACGKLFRSLKKGINRPDALMADHPAA